MVRRLPNGMLKWDKDDRKEMPQFLENIYLRLHVRDQNFVMAITGKPGTGKSYAGLSLCQSVDPNFSVENNVVYRPMDIIDIVNDKKKVYDGMAILWEEVGVGIDAKNWHSPINKAISHLAQTFRKKHICLVMTVPDASFFDSSVRKLLNCIAEMEEKMDRKSKISKARIFIPNYSYRFKKEYFAAPRYNLKREKKPYTVRVLQFPKVDDETAKSYEKSRAAYMEQQNKELAQEISNSINKGEKKLPVEDIAAKISNNPDKYMNERGNLDAGMVMMLEKCNRNNSYTAIKMAQAMLRLNS